MTTRVTVSIVREMKHRGEKITMLTAYDVTFARILDEAGVDLFLVGDSIGSVFSGYPNTLPVTVDKVIDHTKAVVRGAMTALVVIGMPFMSYHITVDDAKRNAGRMIKKSGAAVVKLEGGVNMKDVIRSIVDIGIPVMGHIGLTPQSIHQIGGYKLQGKMDDTAERCSTTPSPWQTPVPSPWYSNVCQ
jgi:3-methyl-2-oxobutanoate hydroxymethyltransferase